jgi:transcriptional regulator with XRE-family HTH domain
LNVCGKELLKLRAAREMSQESLAARCQLAGWDVSRDIIANIELQRRMVSDLDLSILARVLKVPIEELYPSKIRSRLP